MQEEGQKEQEVKPYKDLYASLYASKIGENGEPAKDYLLEVLAEEDEDFVGLEEDEYDHNDDLRHK